ncbi:MAG: amylo-alpha-1,6-glucosidase [Candidatus Bathyarchaeia archaeon]
MSLPVIRLTQDVLSLFDEALQKEWLVTNGLGGYASSTVLGMNTRKYHGLLVAALNPPGRRTVCLSKLDEEIIINGSVYMLGTTEFRDVIFPQGFKFLKEFSIAPFPRYIYHVQSIEVDKTLFMPKGRNEVVAVYTVRNHAKNRAYFRIYPLFNCRHFHSVTNRKLQPLSFTQHQSNNEVEVALDSPRITVKTKITKGEFIVAANWIDNIYYREEENRGESSSDDCYQAGYFEIQLNPEQKAEFAVATAASENSREVNETLKEIGTIEEVKHLFESELKQRSDMLSHFYSVYPKVPVSDWLNWVLLAADTFITKSINNAISVIAGYYWFETWGRDTFISLPGLMLVTNRFEDAKNILLSFTRHCKQGLIPNYIDDQCGISFYNTVDATLWYVNAILQYLKYTGDFKFVEKNLWTHLKAIIQSHEEGTAFGIHVDSDGLLMHGPRLTWMDAEVNGTAVTPRAGKAVEIQALWYNTLKTLQLLANRFHEASLADRYADMADKAYENFNLKFWNAEKRCLFDVVSTGGSDGAVRPNQIIAAALDFTVLDESKSADVVATVQAQLLTPFGLQTLSKECPQYKGIYAGDRRNRDIAYHNGTVWAWLLGPFTTAFLKTKRYSSNWRQYALETFIKPLFTQQIATAGLGTISEIFDGDAPHIARGCIAQAWSVAEPLRAYVEDILQIRPSYEKEVLQT